MVKERISVTQQEKQRECAIFYHFFTISLIFDATRARALQYRRRYLSQATRSRERVQVSENLGELRVLEKQWHSHGNGLLEFKLMGLVAGPRKFLMTCSLLCLKNIAPNQMLACSKKNF